MRMALAALGQARRAGEGGNQYSGEAGYTHQAGHALEVSPGQQHAHTCPIHSATEGCKRACSPQQAGCIPRRGAWQRYVRRRCRHEAWERWGGELRQPPPRTLQHGKGAERLRQGG